MSELKLISVGEEKGGAVLWIDRGLKSGKLEPIRLSPLETVTLARQLLSILEQREKGRSH